MGLWALGVFMVASQVTATVPAAPATTSAPDDALVALVSVERIREGLQRPGLKIPPFEFVPVFRATVDERLFENPLQGMRRELAENSGYSGRGGVDVLALAMGLVKSIKGVSRPHRSPNPEGSAGSAGRVLRRA